MEDHLKEANISSFCTTYPYLKAEDGKISFIQIEYSKTHICDETLKSVLRSPYLKNISFANNNITVISKIWKTHSSHLEKMWFGGNPIECNCDMLWTMDWLENSTGASAERLVQDYQHVVCATGPQKGTPVYKLNRVTMRCYPKHTLIWIIVTASSISGIVLLLVITMLILTS